MSRAASCSTVKSTPEVGSFELLVTGDGGVWHVALPAPGELSIGRAMEAALRLHGDRVSRRHALFRVFESSFALRDLGSANGTIVHGQPVAPETERTIVAGEAYTVGEFLIVLRTRRAASLTRHNGLNTYRIRRPRKRPR